MPLTIIWIEKAQQGLKSVIAYLEKDWTKKEILQLEKNLIRLIERIKVYPDSCPKSTIQKK